MKKYILFFAALFVAITSMAYDVEYAGCYKSFKLEFQSVDENNDPITLSELVTIPLEKDGVTNREVGFFVLNSIVFTSNMNGAPTGSMPADGDIQRTIATEGAMCVQVDGQGYGSSEGKPLTYLVNKLTARQSIDGLFAAMDYARANGIPVSDKYYTLNTGYSLDGGHAIAIQRYLEKYASEEEKARFRLKQTICGGAPINATASLKYALDEWLNKTQYGKIMYGFVDDNAQGALHAVDKSDIFNPDSTLRQDVIDGTSAAGRALWKAISKENMDEDWVPETPIKYIHWTNDTVVTYENAEIALKAWGHDKFRIMNQKLTDMQWNVSTIRTVHDVITKYAVSTGHECGAADYYAGIIDGCLRDTLIANSYTKVSSFKDMLTVLFDVSSNLRMNIPVNFSANLRNGIFHINTIGNCSFTGEMLDSLGAKTADINVAVKPEILDSLSSTSLGINANGYLHLPVEFSIKMYVKGLEIPITGTCNDVYQTVENLSAVVLHRTCPNEEDAEKFCNAFNSNMLMHAVIPLINANIDIVLWYDLDKESNTYRIEPYSLSTSTTGKKTYTKLNDFLKALILFNVNINLDEYTSIDNQSFDIKGYTAEFHVTERNYGEIKLYANILKEDKSLLARVDLDVTGVDMNEDGTRQTFKIDFTVNLGEMPVKVTGTCNNLNDAILTAILCFGNLSCPTQATAQAYADAVNQNVQLELYVAKVNDDGTYPEELSYIDYGAAKAITAQDEFGAYYPKYIVNWMGKGEIDILALINLILK